MKIKKFSLLIFTFMHAFQFMACGKTPLLKIDGSVLIGGLVAVHDAGGNNNLLCSNNISMFGIMRVEAMRYAIDKINKDPDLPFSNGMKLGIEIRDSCGTETIALDESLQFINADELSCKSQIAKPFYGVVGDGSSVSTASAASLLSLFKIPLISYGATSTELSDQSKYKFLLRTVPDDSLLSLAMLDFIEKLAWTSVFLLYSSGSYGEFGYASFKKAITQKNSSLCIVDRKKIPPGASVSDLKKIISEFNRYPKITGIVCYCETPDAKTIVKAINEKNLTNHYRIIGSSMIPWYQVKTNNTVSFSLYRKDSSMENDFYKNWYSSLSPDNFTTNDTAQHTYESIFKKFWKHACIKNERRTNLNLNCDNTTNSSFRFCLNSTIEETCRKDDVLSYIFDAIYAFAHAIHDVLNNVYKGNTTLFLNQTIDELGFFEHLKNVSFNGSTGFISFYNINAHYGIYYKEELIKIGLWKSSVGLNISNEFDFKINSTCQNQCQLCSKKVFTSEKCCWTCEKCKENEYVENNVCKICPNDHGPNESCNGCKKLPEKKMEKVWQITIATLCISGFVATLTTIFTFFKHNSTPLVRASGREITYLILTGIMLMYLLPISLLNSYTNSMCAAFRFGVGVCLSVCHASLFIKTTRIDRIFSGRQDLLFITPHWQIVLTVFFIVPQICISCIGLYQNKYKLVREKDKMVLKCYSESVDFFATVAYNLLLIFLTAYKAFKTRKVPSNFNESRYIGFVMYTSIVVWLTFLPFFFSSSTELQTLSVILDTIIVATTFLVGLYGVKMYILLLRPNKNKKAHSVTFFEYKSESSNGTVVIEPDKQSIQLSICKNLDRSS
ncbi:metabotropic glutamate receptor 8 [Hydra vulgaris]|uniref:metabotropic glutamate receptor 8 n=1 Tax=Hydra vulgaris TaxID=6087 RepID=UPI001F5F634C|nr:metabotropic glutamate receptor 8 [Hydra vulgaris]